MHNQDHRKDGSISILSSCQPEGAGFRSFEVAGLTPDQTTLTGMRDDILLLSWFIVLLRTQEGGKVSYDWAYRGSGNDLEHETVKRCLSMDEVMTGMQDNVNHAAAAVSRHISSIAPDQVTGTSEHVSLLLSTSSLSRFSEDMKDEVSGYPIFNQVIE